MSKIVLFTFVFLFCVYGVRCRGVNGGLDCAVCTVIMGIASQVAEIHEESLMNATARLCNYLPLWATKPCLRLVNNLDDYAHDMKHLTPDLICLTYGSCTVDKERLCHLFPLFLDEKKLIHKFQRLKNRTERRVPIINPCKLPLIDDICNILNNSYVNLYPAQDADNDGHSMLATVRGSDWTGKDCDDFDASVRPGRKPYLADRYADSNCNGIYGIDEISGLSFEDVLCSDSDRRGIIYIGDSVGAHFHMPEIWMNPIDFTPPTTVGLSVILDELDWPQFGFATGFKNITTSILINGAVDSIYLRLRERNLCNHRDYQNVAKNGASSYEAMSFIRRVVRSRNEDEPAIVFYAMIGNDVCNNFAPEETINQMTTPESFRTNLLNTLNVLNAKLPPKSHVILVGLVDASFIYDAMAERIHPLGKLHDNVRYKDVYKWFNCMEIGPCTGWLNSNSTLRNLTSQRARDLTNVLRNVAKRKQFKNFSLHFINNPINSIMNKSSVDVPSLLESVDSLHPNQLAQPLLAREIWNDLEINLPNEVLGKVNPNNARIKEIFGDQGGH